MNSKKLISELIATDDKAKQRELIKNNSAQIDLQFAEELKNTYYDSWRTEPSKTRNAALALDVLFEFLPEEEVRALSKWVEGIAELAEGKAETAIERLDEAAEIFSQLAQKNKAAQTQVAKIYALALLGRYDEAFATGENAIKDFEALNDYFAVGKIEHNLGNIHWRRGNFAAARRFFNSAYQRLSAFDDEAQLIMVEHCLADIDSLQNDFRSAENLLQKALARARNLKLLDTEAKIETNLGNLAFFRGRYHESLKFLEKSREKYARLKMPHQTALADLEIADVYLELNLLREACDIYQKIAPEFESFKMRAEEARTRMNLGKTLVELGETEKALDELKKAENLYHLEENKLGEALVKLIIANLKLREKNFAESKKHAVEAEKIFRCVNSPRHVLLSGLVRGESERCLENFAVAETIFNELLERSEIEEQPQIAWAAANALGLLAKDRGNFHAAEKCFEKSVEIIENLRAPLAADEFRTAFFTDKLAPYQNLADICRRDSSRIAESLNWIERARSQALLDLLASSNRRQKLTDDPALQSKFDNLREELNWFYSRLNRPESGEITSEQNRIENLRREIRERENEINALVLQIEAAGENVADRENDFDLPKLQKALGVARVLIEFAEFDGEFAAFVVGENSVELVENLGSADEIQKILEQIHFQFGTLRYGAKALQKHLPLLKQRVNKLLQNLYEILLRPLEDLIAEKNLVFVPSKNLHYVPFQALFDGEKYLVESREISYAPSAAVLQSLLNKKTSKIENALVAGFADERVPMVEREVENLSNVSPETFILKGANAAFETIRQKLNERSFDVLHLACHGQFRAENPLFSSLHLADGWATVREAARLRLENALVVLSACETGLSAVGAGEELLGLVRGFLAAGANALVLSLWTVNDEATADLMNDFYAALKKGDSLAASLRAAQLRFIEQNAHPYFWSPFILTGKW